MRPRLLDLFCGAGGTSAGYHAAGFDVTGVDLEAQPRYPYRFLQADALDVDLDGYDAVHASPPCQAYTQASNRWRGNGGRADNHADLIAATRDRLVEYGRPYVIENVVGAVHRMRPTLLLAGGMFGLGVHRPRLFESNVVLLTPGPGTRGTDQIGVYGEKPDGRRLNSRTRQRAASSLAEGAAAMGIDWMVWRELCEAIPPAYTEYIGRQLLAYVGAAV